ncbi:MAG: trypsin-like peptidase domain-containing protein [Chlamydiia bacterium]|nr:trypsin-like peptidase domain-containing protein [Chlamydiia bacterium]
MKSFFLSVVLCFAPFLLHSNLSFDQLVEKTYGNTVEVVGVEKPKGWFNNNEGNSYYIQGFFLNEEGMILTCKDFVEGHGGLIVRWIDPKGHSHEEPATIVAVHPTVNVAILMIDAPKMSVYPHNPLVYEPFTIGSNVFMSSGNISQNENFPMMGRVLNTFKNGNVREAMIAIPNLLGGRGSPIFNADGSIIGVQIGSYIYRNFVSALPLLFLENWINETLK